MNRRAIAILGAIFLLIVGTLGFLLYQRQHNNKVASTNQQQQNPAPTPQPQQPDQPAAPTEPEQPAARAVKLSDDQVVSPVLFFQGNGITYLNQNGQLFQVDLKVASGTAVLSNKREVTIPLKSGLVRALWPAEGNGFIAELDTGATRQWSYYNGDKGTYTELPDGISSLDWLGSNKIMFEYVDKAGKATLNIANPDGSDYKTVLDMYEGDDELEVAPDGKSLVFWRTQSRDATNPIHWLSADGTQYKALVATGFNLGVKWSPSGSKFVFGRRDPNGQNYQLWLADVASGTVKSLGVNTTPDKVVWTKSGNYLYTSVPKSGTSSSLTEDSIFKINVVSGDKQEFDPGITVDGQDLFLDYSENILFFRNQQDQALYYMDMSK